MIRHMGKSRVNCQRTNFTIPPLKKPCKSNACRFQTGAANLPSAPSSIRELRITKISPIPAIELRGLSAARKRALALADNKIGDNAGWDREQLAIELPELS